MIQYQGTSACLVGATPRVVVDRIGRLDPLPRGSKLGALQKRGVGLTEVYLLVLLVLLCQVMQSTSVTNITLEENVGSLLLPLPGAAGTDQSQRH